MIQRCVDPVSWLNIKVVFCTHLRVKMVSDCIRLLLYL